MLSCHLCRRSCITSLVSVRLPLPSPALRRSYTALTSKPHATSSALPPPRQFSPRKPRPLLDRIAFTDPVKLADTVRRRLQRGQRDSALKLAREASRHMNSVVSWNHVIKHHMDNAEVKRAFSAFNEMKKRGIHPDAYTFTIILNGLSEYALTFTQSLDRALQLYNSLSNPKSPVTPNVFHTNAVLKVCARCKDIDSMWSIVGKLPAKGPNAPNTVTYTTLLEGICMRSIDDGDVEDGRRVWAGVLSRWGKGQLWVDDELACAMGRVLLSGERESDWREVFALIEQVFGIPSLDSGPQRPAEITSDSIFASGTDTFLKPPTTTTTTDPAPTNTKVYTPPILSRNPLPTVSPSSTRPTPSNRTLSIILKACTNLKDSKTASKYWTTLTSPPYFLHPDLENYHDLLRSLRRSRLGAEAVKVVTEMRVPPSPKTFYIALSSCKRSGRSGSFSYAEQLLELMMQKYGMTVDVKVWNMFLQCAVKSGLASNIKQALRRIDEAMDVEEMVRGRRGSEVFIERALDMVKIMVGAVDVLLMDGEKVGVRWAHGERSVYEERRSVLSSVVTRYSAGMRRRNYTWQREEEE